MLTLFRVPKTQLKSTWVVNDAMKHKYARSSSAMLLIINVNTIRIWRNYMIYALLLWIFANSKSLRTGSVGILNSPQAIHKRKYELHGPAVVRLIRSLYLGRNVSVALIPTSHTDVIRLLWCYPVDTMVKLTALITSWCQQACGSIAWESLTHYWRF